MDQQIIEKAKRVNLLILDVDGVLTDGSMIYDDRGNHTKTFNVKDGLGIVLLADAGVSSVILTAKDSKVVRKRAKDLKIKDVFCGFPKDKFIGRILKKYKVGLENLCFIGDELIDIDVAKKVGFSVAVNDACPELKEKVDFVTQCKGGKGAVRELTELIIKAKGLWKWF
jgi:3-deoxy-D-manno-octulosonate 8-phosphate phosphatase (KDO 8-P phosphatase)